MGETRVVGKGLGLHKQTCGWVWGPGRWGDEVATDDECRRCSWRAREHMASWSYSGMVGGVDSRARAAGLVAAGGTCRNWGWRLAVEGQAQRVLRAWGSVFPVRDKSLVW